jgi:hypothetical protein
VSDYCVCNLFDCGRYDNPWMESLKFDMATDEVDEEMYEAGES